MRDNTRKQALRHLPAVLAVALAIVAAPRAIAQTTDKAGAGGCTAARATLGEKGLPTPEISTEQMEVAMAREGPVLVIDARPYEEFAMGHIAGARNVAPKPGLPMSQFTSDVGEIEKLTGGQKGSTIVLYCNGPFCGKSKRLAQDLLGAGYTHVSRYELGIPVWRALGHPVQVEADALWSTLDKDRTAVVIDARDPAAFQAGSLPGARNVRFEEVAKAKDDGRLPMLDHNTRIFVVGKDSAQALAAAQEVARNAFQNVGFYAGTFESLIEARPAPDSR